MSQSFNPMELENLLAQAPDLCEWLAANDGSNKASTAKASGSSGTVPQQRRPQKTSDSAVASKSSLKFIIKRTPGARAVGTKRPKGARYWYQAESADPDINIKLNAWSEDELGDLLNAAYCAQNSAWTGMSPSKQTWKTFKEEGKLEPDGQTLVGEVTVDASGWHTTRGMRWKATAGANHKRQVYFLGRGVSRGMQNF